MDGTYNSEVVEQRIEERKEEFRQVARERASLELDPAQDGRRAALRERLLTLKYELIDLGVDFDALFEEIRPELDELRSGRFQVLPPRVQDYILERIQGIKHLACELAAHGDTIDEATKEAWVRRRDQLWDELRALGVDLESLCYQLEGVVSAFKRAATAMPQEEVFRGPERWTLGRDAGPIIPPRTSFPSFDHRHILERAQRDRATSLAAFLRMLS